MTSVLMTADTLGGVFTYSITLARELAEHGVVTHLATMGALLRPEQRAVAACVPGLVLHESAYALEWMDEPWQDVARAGEWLSSLERELAPDVVHLNGYAHGALAFRAPKVVVAHSCVLSWWEAVFGEPAPRRYARYRSAVHAGLLNADVIVAISRSMSESIARHYGPLAQTKVVYNGAPLPQVSAVEKEPFVLSCGRVWDRAKNVEALARVAGRVPWPIRVAGWDSDAHEGLESLGWLGERELGSWMDRAAIFALPARYEPFGLSALEAALRGAALVVGDIPSLREIWGDAATFVDPADDDALAAALTTLAREPGHRARLAERAKTRALQYTSERTADGMLRIYAELGRREGLVSCA
ncbi:MAG TPA: glycosyltransferase family 4 protein [Labilithrix sp.]|nr:glycosyltransferase family 4 protein [Labilithrix sp.]